MSIHGGISFYHLNTFNFIWGNGTQIFCKGVIDKICYLNIILIFLFCKIFNRNGMVRFVFLIVCAYRLICRKLLLRLGIAGYHNKKQVEKEKGWLHDWIFKYSYSIKILHFSL